MQAVLVSPTPRMAIVLGKVLGGASIASIQGVTFLLFWPLVTEGSTDHIWLKMLASVPVIFVLSSGLTAMGFSIAWRMESTAGFHSVMMLFLMPMWFLSGAVFPINEQTPSTLKIIMCANPMTYGQATFTWILVGTDIGAPGEWYLWPSLTILFTMAIILKATQTISKPRKDGLP